MPSRRPRPARRPRVAVVVAIVILTSLAAGLAAWQLTLSRGVDAAAAPRAGHPTCEGVATRWPTTVAGRGRVPVRDDPPAVAAWGDPAMVARCGATSPGPTTDDCVAANGVDWVGRQVGGGMVFLSYGRDPAVEVFVPSAYAPEPLVLGAFADAVGAVPQGEHRCR